MQNHCAVSKCSSGKSGCEPLFRFPLDPERSKKWVEECQRQDLTDKPAEQLYRYYRVCGKHFEKSFIDGDAQSAVLKDDAVPSLFDVPQNKQGKRGKETTKESETETKGRKKIKKSQPDTTKEDAPAVPEEDEDKEYLKSLFEVLFVLGEQSIPPLGPADHKELFSNIQALLAYRTKCGDKVLQKRLDENKEYCSSEQLNQVMEVCEKFIRDKLVEEVKQNGFFSLLTDDLVKISGDWFLPVFVRYVDQSNHQKEKFLGFLSFEGNGDALAENLLSEMTEKWGLDLEQCRGQAHFCTGTHFCQIKAFASKLSEKYPRAVPTLRATANLNVALAAGMHLSAVQLVMSTFKKIESFFGRSTLLPLEMEHAISIFFADKEEKANELKDVSLMSWTSRHDVFEVAAEIIEALLLCVDSVHDNEDMRWEDDITHNALEISKALTDFEFIMALVVLKNVMTLTRAFGKNIKGSTADLYFAATSLKAVLHSLREVSDNIDVYHEFWFDEAANLAAAMEVTVKVPRSYMRKTQAEPGTVRPESYYKENLSIPVVNHIIRELNELFSDDHLKVLRCLSLVPTVIDQNKTTEPDEDCMQVFNNDIPNAGTLSAELHCWWVKWSKRGKNETLPSCLSETLQLADVKFFPNMLAVLRLIGILPTLVLDESSDVAYKRFRMYMENMPEKFKSKSLALLNINYDVAFDLDSMVEVYMKTYPERPEES